MARMEFVELPKIYRIPVREHAAYVCGREYLARVNLQTKAVEWQTERRQMLRCARFHLDPDADLWINMRGDTLVQLKAQDAGSLTIQARDSQGTVRWQTDIPLPEPAAWAEQEPAWEGAPTEENEFCLGADPTWLVLWNFRQSRQLMRIVRSSTVDSRGLMLPPYACQLDAVCLDPVSGQILWKETYPGLHAGILERRRFTGLWGTETQIGRIELPEPSVRVLFGSEHPLSWPREIGSRICSFWRARGKVGVVWLDRDGTVLDRGEWRQTGVKRTAVHATNAGAALQINEQTLTWLGEGSEPAWEVKAKPWIYAVIAAADHVFVGTDGRGGRLLAFNAATGQEVLNFRPKLGGCGTLSKVPSRDMLVTSFQSSKSWDKPADLLIVTAADFRTEVLEGCGRLVAVWEHGALCLPDERRLAIVKWD